MQLGYGYNSLVLGNTRIPFYHPQISWPQRLVMLGSAPQVRRCSIRVGHAAHVQVLRFAAPEVPTKEVTEAVEVRRASFTELVAWQKHGGRCWEESGWEWIRYWHSMVFHYCIYTPFFPQHYFNLYCNIL